MKINESWLREWVSSSLQGEALAERLTLAGFEVNGVNEIGVALEKLFVAQVSAVGPHPNADRLSVCQVSIESGEPLQIVCGAPNVRAGMRAIVALPGAVLPDGKRLKRSKLRGVESQGMLCSASELGIGDDSDGIVELAPDATVGEDIAEYLGLPDIIFDVDITPNRGDCFSILGIAREVAAFSDVPLTPVEIAPVVAQIDTELDLDVGVPRDCPRFAGRVIRGIDGSAVTPVWMTERLRRCGIRSIHPVVDVTNYVMLELGQPLHGYDYQKISGALRVRRGESGERLKLLDDRDVVVEPEDVVIADDTGAIGLAGIMGGQSTAVDADTVDVFLEAAFWPPNSIAGRARQYGLHTDASLRFERGVDPDGQTRAVERASALLIGIAGGKPGPLTEQLAAEHLPGRDPVRLERPRVARVLGIELPDETISDIFRRLGLPAVADANGWTVTPPPHRFDLAIAEDLIEEIARIYGYHEIPEITAVSSAELDAYTETRAPLAALRQTMVDRGYQEIITYSFVEPELQGQILGPAEELELTNPLSRDYAVMRRSLLPGLLGALRSNQSRQHTRLRLFELGSCFLQREGELSEVQRIGAIATGRVTPEQWGDGDRGVDFFAMKSDLEQLLGANARGFEFAPHAYPFLHPGQSASVALDGAVVGFVGSVHPQLLQDLDIDGAAQCLEIAVEAAAVRPVPRFSALSKFPAVRRDIALLLPLSTPVAAVEDIIRQSIPELLTDVVLFDIYQGDRIEAGVKSVAFGLILQETSRTLTDDEVDRAVRSATVSLERKLGAKLRDR